jgi:DNA-binding transcriptional LysR family regulator
MDPEVRQLRALLAVVEAGTFTGAADLLGTSQASVSRTVAALERTLGARVLHRTTREVALTPLGRQVAGHARRVLEEVAAIRRAADPAGAELRVGSAWSALGRHTTAVQRRWSAAHPGSAVVFVHAHSRTAGLAEGLCDVAVVRRPVDDPRFATALVGMESRYAALAADDPLARRRTLRLADVAGRTVAVDPLTGTTDGDLWADATPAATRTVRGIEDWLTVVAAGQAVGVSAEATAAQHRRPGVVYRPVRDAPPIRVWLAWWADSPPPQLDTFRRLVAEEYDAAGQAARAASGRS